MKNILKSTLTAGLVLLLGGLLIVGCESDSVAPHDDTPELSAEAAANQAAVVALAITEVGPVIVSLNKTIVPYTFENFDYVEGQVNIDYRLGGPEGADASPSTADYAHLWTLGEDGLVITPPDAGDLTGANYLTADLMGNIDQEAGTVTILEGSGGTMITGVITGEYALNGLVLGGNPYPSAGELVFTVDAKTLTVTFDGSPMAMIELDDDGVVSYYQADLDTGVVTDYTPPTF
jgi:hypothetical protein